MTTPMLSYGNIEEQNKSDELDVLGPLTTTPPMQPMRDAPDGGIPTATTASIFMEGKNCSAVNDKTGCSHP